MGILHQEGYQDSSSSAVLLPTLIHGFCIFNRAVLAVKEVPEMLEKEVMT